MSNSLAAFESSRKTLAQAALLLLLFLLLGRVASADDLAPWLIEDRAGVLQVRLAHAERTRPDGGVLTVDPNRRVVTWEGIPGDLGCRQKLEAPFARIRAVRGEPEGVLRLEVRLAVERVRRGLGRNAFDLRLRTDRRSSLVGTAFGSGASHGVWASSNAQPASVVWKS